MKIYSNTLTMHDLFAAAERTGVGIVGLEEIRRPRVRASGWKVYLTGSSSYRSQATGIPAATWDEHGIWMSELYKLDREARIAHYKSLDEFISWTRHMRDHASNDGKRMPKKLAPWLDDPELMEIAAIQVGEDEGEYVGEHTEDILREIGEA